MDQIQADSRSGTFLGMPKPWAMAVVLGGIFFVAGQWISAMPQGARGEITVQGVGKVEVKPDVATLNLGVNTEPLPTSEAANAALSESFNAVLAAVRGAGVAEDDIKTNYVSVNPAYDFLEGGRALRGYEASGTVTVKVRDTNAVGSVLTAATGAGATQAGGVQFDIDEPEVLEEQARDEAITDAKKNAQELAGQLGVRLGKVKSFDSSAQGSDFPIPYALSRAEDAVGGDIETPSGTQDVIVHATVTYELR